jgi:hypothetical protein
VILLSYFDMKKEKPFWFRLCRDRKKHIDANAAENIAHAIIGLAA